MTLSAKPLILCTLLALAMHAQTNPAPARPEAAPQKADAYYNFAMGHLYAELAGAYGNRAEYVNKAIEHYRQALKLDPAAGFLVEELADLYIQAGRLRDAVLEAEEMLKQNPDNLDARRILARIYTRMIGDTQQGRIDEKMLRSAIEQYEKIVAKDPKDTETWLMLGRLYKYASNSTAAEKAFNAVLAADPNNEDALAGLAFVYSDLGDTAKAVEKLKQLSDTNPSPRTLTVLANAYEQLRDYKSAAAVLRRALEIQPDNTRVKRALAQNLMYSENYDESLKLFTEVAAEEPRDPQAYLRMSEIYRQKHDFAKARTALEKAKQLDRDSLEIRYDEVNLLDAEGKTVEAVALMKSILNDTAKKTYSGAERANRAMLLERLGTLHRGANQYDAAIDAFRQIAALDADNSARALVQVVDTYRAARDYAKAQVEADAALKKFPNDRMVKMMRASVLADMGKVDEAAAEVRSLIRGDNDRETLLALAQIYEKGKNHAEQAKALEAAEKLSASDPDKATVAFMRGAMYEKMKDFARAEAEFRKVLALDPDNASALNYLGYMLADRGVRLDEAQKLVSRALELEPNNGAYLDSLAWVYYQQNKLADAESLLLRALDRIGKDPTVHEHLGDVYFKQGKTREAIVQWQASLQEWQVTSAAEADPAEIAKVQKKLEGARVKLAKETGK